MEEYERILNWIPAEFEVYHHVLNIINEQEFKKGELEKKLSGIDPALGQRVLAFGIEKGIIKDFGEKYKVSYKYLVDETPYLIVEAED